MIATLVLRVLSLLFAAVVLGLSITLIRGENKGHYTDSRGIKFDDSGAPAQTGYVAFCGGWALLFSLIGIAAIFVEFLQGIIMSALDVLSALITLIGGIVFAVGMKGGSCNDVLYLITNRIVRGADQATLPDGTSGPAHATDVNLGSRCHQGQAIYVFLFFLFACFLATAVLGFMGKGRRSNRSYA